MRYNIRDTAVATVGSAIGYARSTSANDRRPPLRQSGFL